MSDRAQEPGRSTGPAPCSAGIREAQVAADVRVLWPLMHLLRPRLEDADELVSSWVTQAEAGYRIAYVCDGDGRPVGAVGFRLVHTLAWGRHISIDDLIVAVEARRLGVGARLLAHVEQEARALHCSEIHLDTGYERHDAHRLYLRSGYRFRCHHASKRVRLTRRGDEGWVE